MLTMQVCSQPPQCLGTSGTHWDFVTRGHTAVLGVGPRAAHVFCKCSPTKLHPQPRTVSCGVKWIIHLVVKVNCWKSIVKNSLYLPFKLFLYPGCRFLTCKLEPLKKIFLKNDESWVPICTIFFVVLYTLFTIKSFLCYKQWVCWFVKLHSLSHLSHWNLRPGFFDEMLGEPAS